MAKVEFSLSSKKSTWKAGFYSPAEFARITRAKSLEQSLEQCKADDVAKIKTRFDRTLAKSKNQIRIECAKKIDALSGDLNAQFEIFKGTLEARVRSCLKRAFDRTTDKRFVAKVILPVIEDFQQDVGVQIFANANTAKQIEKAISDSANQDQLKLLTVVEDAEIEERSIKIVTAKNIYEVDTETIVDRLMTDHDGA